MANRAFMSFGKMYANHTMPVIIDCNFTVDPTDTDGYGITGLKSNGYVKNVYMHTSATPADGNPNPASGYILVQMQDNYNRFLGEYTTIQAPVTGLELAVTSGAAALTVGVAYQITTLGTTTTAEWVTLGLPAGLTPSVGQSFIALVTGTGSSTGKVKAIGTSGVDSIEVVGSPQGELGPQGVSNQGAWLLFKCNGNTFTAGAYTPAGTNSVPTFTGDALAGHDHDFTPAGTNANDGPPETFTGTPGTTSSDSAGTPSGTISAPTFTGTPATITGTITSTIAAPTAGSLISMVFYFDNSSVTVDGD